jgi:hypothetical protein
LIKDNISDMDNNPQSNMGISLYAHIHNLNNHIILMGSYTYLGLWVFLLKVGGIIFASLN